MFPTRDYLILFLKKGYEAGILSKDHLDNSFRVVKLFKRNLIP